MAGFAPYWRFKPILSHLQMPSLGTSMWPSRQACADLSDAQMPSFWAAVVLPRLDICAPLPNGGSTCLAKIITV